MNVRVSPDPGSWELGSIDSLSRTLASCVNELIASFPQPSTLSADERRGIVARYGSVLEGNFIYWMTGCFLAARSEVARDIIHVNLLEEVRDCHPGMLRNFVREAGATPDETDIHAVESNLANVRKFVGRLSPTALIAMMAFFEMFIQRFMSILEEIASLQGSEEMEYTRVHGTCDIFHSQELVRALAAEITLVPPAQNACTDLFEGVDLLRALIHDIVFGPVIGAASI
jgi:hypothetical protein